MGIQAAAFHTSMAIGRWSKVARLKETGLWRGDANSPHYGHGNDAENFLAMDMVMPQARAPAAAPPNDSTRPEARKAVASQQYVTLACLGAASSAPAAVRMPRQLHPGDNAGITRGCVGDMRVAVRRRPPAHGAAERV